VLVDRNVTIAQSLFNTLRERQPTEWSHEEMLEQQEKGGFNSYRTLRPPFQAARPIQRFPPATAAVESTSVVPTRPPTRT
jgi:hypothetical protein